MRERELCSCGWILRLIAVDSQLKNESHALHEREINEFHFQESVSERDLHHHRHHHHFVF